MNFNIRNNGLVSQEFLKLGITDFQDACTYIARLDYKRNADKQDVLCVFKDNAGTCSTKHAALRKLALEHQRDDMKLILGIFKMDAAYSSKIAGTLSKNGLDYIPEAHNYLKIDDEYLDFTRPDSSYTEIEGKVLQEVEIEYNQINTEKVKIHKDFLERWVAGKPQFDLEKIWTIREDCIADLQG